MHPTIAPALAEPEGQASPTPSPPLCICMVAAMPFPTTNGTSGSIREMAEAVAQLGHEVHIVTYHFGQDIPVRGVHVHRIKPLFNESSIAVGPTVRKPLYDLQIVTETLRVIRRVRPSVLHAHAHEAGLAAGICRLITGIPVVYSGHSSMAEELPTFRHFRPRWAAVGLGKMLDWIVPRMADRVIPHSPNMERLFREQNLGGRAEPVVPFGINFDEVQLGDAAEIRRQFNLGDGPIVLYSGMLASFQRLDLLLEAMCVVVREFPTAKLLLVRTLECDSLADDLLKQIQRLGLSDHVVLTPPQELQAAHRLLAAADVAVAPRPMLPGFPIKLLNYLAARKPSVLFASSANGLTHGDTVLLAAPDTGEAFGKMLVEALRDPDLRKRLGERGYEFARANYDRSGTAQRLCAVYERTELLTTRRRAIRRRE